MSREKESERTCGEAKEAAVALTDEELDRLIEEFDRELAELDLRGHWARAVRTRPEPRPKLWKWDTIYTQLMRAGELIGLDSRAHSDRRTLQLIPPGQDRTSPNVQMSVQLVKPGESAPAHRHTFAATRFIVQGDGAYTTVDGEPLYLSAGDFVTTPSMSYHDHTNESTQNIIWLDVHDGPLTGKIGAQTFRDDYPAPVQPLTRSAGTSRDLAGVVRPANRATHPAQQPAAYAWSEVRPALERAAEGPADPWEGILLDYVNPVTGGHLLPTLGARIQMLLPKMHTQPHRHTSSTIHHVVEGEGVTVIGDERLEWSKGDCFTIPTWKWHSHEQVGTAPAILFSAHDQPVLEALNYFREEREED